MFYIHFSQTHEGELRREIFDYGHEEGVTICLHPPYSGRGSTHQQDLRQVKEMITKQGLMWITATGMEWTIDIDSFLQQGFATPISDKKWNWLHGPVTMRPSFQEMPHTHDELTLHLNDHKSPTVVFDLTAESIEQSEKPMTHAKPKSDVRLVFISHSSADEDLSNALVSLLCGALKLTKGDFLCITVDGSKLPPGVRTDDALRDQIESTDAFLSLLTPAALKSTYVLFELGARWGLRKDHIPLLAKGAGFEVLKDPLKPTIALNLAEEEDIHRLIERLAETLGDRASHQPTASYVKEIRAVSKAARPLARNPKRPSFSNLSSLADLANLHLFECVAAINTATTPERALSRIREIQHPWNEREKEIVIVDEQAVVFHAQRRVMGTKLDQCWRDQTGRSRSSEMTEDFGMLTLRIEHHADRTTLLLWKHIPKWRWIAVLEAHLHHAD